MENLYKSISLYNYNLMVYNIQKIACCFIIRYDEILCLEMKLNDHFSGLMSSLHKHLRCCFHSCGIKGRDLSLYFPIYTLIYSEALLLNDKKNS